MAVSMLLPRRGRAEKLKERLRQLYFANRGLLLYYCVLADFKEAKFPENADDYVHVTAAKRVN